MKRDYSRYYKRFRGWADKPANQAFGLLSLTLLAIAFFGSFAIMPTFKTIAGLNKEIKDARLVSDQLSKKIASLKTAQNNYAKIVNDQEILNQVLPQKEEVSLLSWQFSWLAAEKGVILGNGNFGSFNLVGPVPAQPTNLDIQLAASGSYPQIKAWLEALTNCNRLVTINELSLNSKNEKINASLKLTAVFLPEEGK